MRKTRLFGAFVLAGTMVTAGLLAATNGPAFAANGPEGPTAAWQAAIASVPLPSAGCFSASYPALKWHATQCKVAPEVPMEPALENASAATALFTNVGNGNDYSAVVTGPITKATGSFGNVSPTITEKGQYAGSGRKLPNTFSLQLNTQFFAGSPACSGSSNPSKCLAWQQFVYDTHSNIVFMQYWLIDYAATCPSSWFTYGSDCYTNSPASTFSGGALTAAELATAKLSGSAKRSGNDAVSLSNGAQVTTVSNPDSVLDLAKSWTTTEFDVFGDGGGGEAKFSKGTTLESQTTLSSKSLAAPTCVLEGFTGETNNLKLTGTPAIGTVTTPTMASEQTNKRPSSASCATAPG